KAGRFRADLFYRLNVLPLRNPPLRDRVEDIPQLAMFFLSRFSRQFGRAVNSIAQETIELMMNYDWPGNIREMQNLIERGVVLSNGSILSIERSLLQSSQTGQTGQTGRTAQPTSGAQPRVVAQAVAPPAAPPPSGVDAPSISSGSSSSLEDLQRQHIIKVLSETNWVIEGEKGAAKMLNLHPNTLRSRLKKMGIQRPK